MQLYADFAASAPDVQPSSMISHPRNAWSADDEEVHQQIEALVSQLTHGSDPGLAILVKKSGNTYFEKGYGVRELGKPAKLDGDDRFSIGQ